MQKIKKGDNVMIITGKDKGKTGEVLKVLIEKNKLVVRGVNIVKKSQKPNPTLGITGGIIEFEKPIDASNVMVVDPKSGKPTRVAFKMVDGKKVRVAQKSGEVIK